MKEEHKLVMAAVLLSICLTFAFWVGTRCYLLSERVGDLECNLVRTAQVVQLQSVLIAELGKADYIPTASLQKTVPSPLSFTQQALVSDALQQVKADSQALQRKRRAAMTSQFRDN